MKSIPYMNDIKEYQRVSFSKLRGKFVMTIYVILNLLVVITLYHSATQGDWGNVFTCIKVLLLFIMLSLLDRILKVELPSILFVSVQLFIFAAMILGEVQAFYIRFSYWDTMLHTINGFLFAVFGYIILNIIDGQNPSNRSIVKQIHFIFTALCFSMTVGVIWEFYEFVMDSFFGRDMQKDTIIRTINSMKINESTHSVTVFNNINDVTINGKNLDLDGYLDIGLYDTMSDLYVNFIGAFIFCLLLYFSYKASSKCKIFRSLITSTRRR
ncbi:hypothetical protein [Aquibacillus kalidii]|uniref:hypothetical protein n=1 Tax=Aquibacillus kalidii TaxID=2762597 RepID=UPI001644C4A4|nr:hypothetical protein [Aquibacillus kalidii]